VFWRREEAVIDGETGFVINPYDTDALSDRLVRLLTDETLRQRMADAGRQRVGEQFTLKRQVDAMIDVYKRALDKQRSRKKPL
jgi:glycosyltransferase involved in cell wall biosynthesis